LSDIEGASLGKCAGDVPYRGGLEGVPRARLDDRNNHSDIPIRRVDCVLQGKGVVELGVGQVKIECSISLASRPSDGVWALRVNLCGGLVELQGQDTGNEKEECTELSEHCER